jgi:hypothetical protein
VRPNSDSGQEIRENRAKHEIADQRAMRHMAHFSVTFWPKTTPKSAQCDTVFTESDAESR